jgi:hypothetical protein
MYSYKKEYSVVYELIEEGLLGILISKNRVSLLIDETDNSILLVTLAFTLL